MSASYLSLAVCFYTSIKYNSLEVLKSLSFTSETDDAKHKESR